MTSEYSTTTALIPVTQRAIGTDTVQTVDGRDLYAFLEIRKDYSNWIKAQIQRGRFLEGRDYIRHEDHGSNPSAHLGDKPKRTVLARVEFYLTFDAAKHIAMMSNADKGHEVREYFLECERALQAAQASRVDRYPELRAIVSLVEEVAGARTLAEQAQKEAQQAKHDADEARHDAAIAHTKADLALEDVQRMTIENFILKNGLLRQFPRSEWKAIATWLRTFCLQQGVSVTKATVYEQSWGEENAYPVSVLAAWLRYEQRRPRQIGLVKDDGL